MNLLDFCLTKNEKAVAQYMLENPELSNTKIAKHIGLGRRTVDRIVNRVKDRAALSGYSPEHDMTKSCPNGYVVKGTSTLYDKTGTVTQQWVKTNLAMETQLKAYREAIEALKEDIPRKTKPKSATFAEYGHPSDMLNLHVLTDYHLGMLAWAEETGEDWNLSKSEEMLVDWFSYAIDNSPNASVGVLAQLGDFLHYDSMMGAFTPTSGHALDSDSRFAKIVRVAIRTMRRIIDMMLDKYEHVHVINSDANHDMTSAIWLRELLYEFYYDYDNVTVDRSPDTYNAYQHGKTALFFHHGHKKKMEAVDSVFVSKFRDIFGQCDHAYAHIGHFHHQAVKESSLMVVEQHRTMAAHDAYATSNGYLSGRSATVVTYSDTFGEVARMTVTPKMLGY